MGYSFQLAASDLLYEPFHRQDSAYHSLFFSLSSCEAMVGTINSLMDPLKGIDQTIHCSSIRHCQTELILLLSQMINNLISQMIEFNPWTTTHQQTHFY